MARDTAQRFIPPRTSLSQLKEIAKGCTACDLYKRGTQTVFGAGATKAKIVLVGEQPGNEEDLQGMPFVGPAGKILDKALAEAGIDRTQTYVTNIVKHFKWEPRGKRRIHKKPGALEIAACKPWFEAEVAQLKPDVIVCLGATAAQALLGRMFRVTQRHGELIRDTAIAPIVVATIHPSSILRAPDEDARHAAMGMLIDDLRKAGAVMRTRPRAA
jgi:DNA polymerase